MRMNDLDTRRRDRRDRRDRDVRKNRDRAMGRWTTRAKTPEDGRETTETSPSSQRLDKASSSTKSGGWLSRAFAKATGRTSGKGGRGTREERTASVTSGATARGVAMGEEVEGTAAAATKAGERVDAREGRGTGANGTTKKMRVEDFEPLKLIGRGAFGA